MLGQYKSVLGCVSIFIGFIAYFIYFKNIFRGKTKPHAFSWSIWGTINAIAFAAQLVKGGGAGSWSTAVTALVCFGISALAFHFGNKIFSHYDWACLAGAFLALLLWILTKDPTASVILLSITDVLGAIPTLRKGYLKPHEDTASAFALNALKFVVAIVALGSYSIATWLFPLTVIVMNTSITSVILVRRRMI